MNEHEAYFIFWSTICFLGVGTAFYIAYCLTCITGLLEEILELLER